MSDLSDAVARALAEGRTPVEILDEVGRAIFHPVVVTVTSPEVPEISEAIHEVAREMGLPVHHDCREQGRHDLPHVMLAQPGDVQTCPRCGTVRKVALDGRVTYEYPARPAAPEDAPKWNCVSYPGEGMHYLGSGGTCRWCGKSELEIRREYDRP